MTARRKKRKLGVIITMSLVTDVDAHSSSSISFSAAGKAIDHLVESGMTPEALLERWLSDAKRAVSDDLDLIGKVMWMEANRERGAQ